MNVHHLELFYYVALNGGVSAAARQMPYGIQQPAISAQILQLEDSLGVTLYQRRPFQLTREGQMLYDHIAYGVGFQVRFQWEANSIAIWDNRCVQHHASWDYFPETRSGYRVTTRGEVPFQ